MAKTILYVGRMYSGKTGSVTRHIIERSTANGPWLFGGHVVTLCGQEFFTKNEPSALLLEGDRLCSRCKKLW